MEPAARSGHPAVARPDGQQPGTAGTAGRPDPPQRTGNGKCPFQCCACGVPSWAGCWPCSFAGKCPCALLPPPPPRHAGPALLNHGDSHDHPSACRAPAPAAGPGTGAAALGPGACAAASSRRPNICDAAGTNSDGSPRLRRLDLLEQALAQERELLTPLADEVRSLRRCSDAGTPPEKSPGKSPCTSACNA